MTTGRARLAAAALLAVVAALLAGCVSASQPRRTPPPGSGPAESGAAGPGAAGSGVAGEVSAGAAAWQIPPAELGTQRLFRVHYDGPQGEVGLRVTLWLADTERYRVSAADALGRAVWTLSIADGNGLWLDHRQESYCRFRGAIDLAAVPLSPFRFAALPALLLGRLPEPPAVPPTAGQREYRDADGKRWTFTEADGRVVAWTVWRGGEPAAWWNGRGDEAILSERRDQVQLRWRQVVREALPALPPEPELPASYVLACDGGGSSAR